MSFSSNADISSFSGPFPFKSAVDQYFSRATQLLFVLCKGVNIMLENVHKSCYDLAHDKVEYPSDPRSNLKEEQTSLRSKNTNMGILSLSTIHLEIRSRTEQAAENREHLLLFPSSDLRKGTLS